MSNVLNKKKNEKGFTLIELIVVIAILGVLVAILLPQFTSFSTKGDKTAVTTDARNLGVVLDACIADGSITNDVGTAQTTTETIEATDLMKAAGMSAGKISSLQYYAKNGTGISAGRLVIQETIHGTTYTATREKSGGPIVVTP